MADEQSIIEIDNLRIEREKGGTVFELSIPKMEVRPGEFIAVIGSSGCGKSTTLDILGLVLQPTVADRFTLHLGEEYGSHDVMDLEDSQLAGIRRSVLGYVLQTGGLFPFLNSRRNILMTSWINGLPGDNDEIDQIAERLQIKEYLNKKPQHLSGGQRQRVAIARALAHSPPIILADEPTAAVDPINSEEICKTLRELATETGVTVLVVTHDVHLFEPVADRIFTYDVTQPKPNRTESVCKERV